MEKTIEIDVQEQVTDMIKNLDSARKEGRLCDVTMKVGSKELRCHKIVLSEGSDYFKRMFNHRMKENESGIAKMEGVIPDCMMMCVQYIYTGKVSIPGGKVLQLLQAAHLLQLTRLCNEVASSLDERLDTDSFFATRKIASTLGLKRMEETCNKFAMKNFESVAVAEGFKDLEKEYIEFLVLSKETEATEDIKCKCLLVWTNSDTSGRMRAFKETFLQLDLSEMPKDYLLYLGKNEPMIVSSAKCMKKLFKATSSTWNASAMDETLKADWKTSDENVIAVFDKKCKAIQAFDPVNKSWQRVNNLQDSGLQNDFATVAIHKDIFVFLKNKTNYKLRYADASALWVRLPDRVNTSRVVAVAFDGAIYAFDDLDRNSKSVEKFDLAASNWSNVCDRPVARYRSSVVAAGDFIYCIGGYNRNYLKKMERLDPPSGTWTTMPPMPTKRRSAVATHLDGNIYVAGGFNRDYLKTFECFDTITQIWITLAEMNHCHSSFSACTVHGKIFVVGGSCSENTIEEFDSSTNKWKVVETMEGKNVFARASVALKL